MSVLAAVIESGSFVSAADALGLSPSGVSKAVTRLETRMGVRLLNRTTRVVAATDEGRSLSDHVGPYFVEIEPQLWLLRDRRATWAVGCE